MSFCFLQKWRRGGKNRSCPGVGSSGREKNVEKGYRRVNMVPILCIYVYKWKKETCWNYSRNGGREDKGE
jgi:hypothetical protein